MERNPRQRHYVSRFTLALMRPVLRYSMARSAYVLRFVGETHGPVLRQNMRRRQLPFRGPERRGAIGQPDLVV